MKNKLQNYKILEFEKIIFSKILRMQGYKKNIICKINRLIKYNNICCETMTCNIIEYLISLRIYRNKYNIKIKL